MNGLRLLAVFHLVSVLALADELVTRPQPPEPGARLDPNGDPLPPNALHRFGTTRFQNGGGVLELELAPSDRYLASMGRRLIVWETATGKQHWSTAVPESNSGNSGYGVRRIAFGPDSQKLFVACGPRLVRVYDVESGDRTEITLRRRGKEDAPSANNNRPQTSIDVSPDGLLAVGSPSSLLVCDPEGLVLYEVKNDPEANVDDGVEDKVGRDRLAVNGGYTFARFSPDANRLAVSVSDHGKELRLLDAHSGELVRTIALTARPVQFAFSRDSLHLVTSERDHTVRLYDVETGERLWEHRIELKNRYENYTSSIAYSTDGSQIAVGATDHRIYVVDAATGVRRGALVGHDWYPWGLAYSTDSKTLYSSGWEGLIRRWNTETLTQLPLPVGEVASSVITISRDGKLVAYVDDADRIRLVDAVTAAPLKTLKEAETDYSRLCFSPDGSRLAAGGSQGDDVVLELWDVQAGALAHRWTWPKGKDPHSHVEDFSFTPDGRKLASAVFRQSRVQVFDLESGLRLPDLKHSQVDGLSFSPDGKELVTVGWDEILRFWDGETFELKSTIDLKTLGLPEQDDERMYTVRFDPTGKFFATAHLVDGIVRIWDAATKKPVTQFQTPGFVYGALAYSPDGRWIATGSSSGVIDLWNARTGEHAAYVGQHSTHVYTLNFGADTGTLVSGGDDDLGIIWKVKLPEGK